MKVVNILENVRINAMLLDVTTQEMFLIPRFLEAAAQKGTKSD